MAILYGKGWGVMVDKSDTHEGVVIIESDTFDANKPVLRDQAEDLFKEQLKNTGVVPTSDINLVKIVHRVGTSVEYHFSASVKKAPATTPPPTKPVNNV